jgi:hypothetical protein
LDLSFLGSKFQQGCVSHRALAISIKKGILRQKKKKKKKKNYGSSNIISPCKNYNLQKIQQKLGKQKSTNATILAFQFSKCNKLWFKQTPQLGSSSHNIPI